MHYTHTPTKLSEYNKPLLVDKPVVFDIPCLRIQTITVTGVEWKYIASASQGNETI